MSLMQRLNRMLTLARVTYWSGVIVAGSLVYIFKPSWDSELGRAFNLFYLIMLSMACVSIIILLVVGLNARKSVSSFPLSQDKTAKVFSSPVVLSALALTPFYWGLILHIMGASVNQVLSFFPISGVGYILMEIFAFQLKNRIREADPMSDYAQ